MFARRSIEELSARAARGLPLFGGPAEELPEEQGYREAKSRNGRVVLLGIKSQYAVAPEPRTRSARELALARDPAHRRREAARKRAARRRGAGSLLVFCVHVPAGPSFEVAARCVRDARRQARAFLGLPAFRQLPPNTVCSLVA